MKVQACDKKTHGVRFTLIKLGSQESFVEIKKPVIMKEYKTAKGFHSEYGFRDISITISPVITISFK